MTLRDLKVGQYARIEAVGGQGALRQHFMPQRLRANLTEMHPRIPNAYDASDKI